MPARPLLSLQEGELFADAYVLVQAELTARVLAAMEVR
jgi:hypothetical protein